MSLFYFGIAVAFLSLYVFFKWVLGSEDLFLFPLVMVVGNTLQGIAESRPESQRQTAGVLRLIVMFVYLSAIVVIVFVPESACHRSYRPAFWRC
jgi:hypothetical protein